MSPLCSICVVVMVDLNRNFPQEHRRSLLQKATAIKMLSSLSLRMPIICFQSVCYPEREFLIMH